MATKESRRQVRELIEGLESRLHRGPPVRGTEIESLKNYLRQNDFSPASDYFQRLTLLELRLRARTPAPAPAAAKCNYGGEAAGYQMQVQSVYDHLLLSTCYAGEFNGKRGRVKLSHRFNQHGRIDFVELKYLRSLHPPLNGELRKLLLINDYASIRRDWLEAPASVLRVLPQELVFLYPDIFRCGRMELFAWLINIGHGLMGDLLQDLKARPARNGRNEPTPVAVVSNHGQSELAYALLENPALALVNSEPWQPEPRNGRSHGAGSDGPASPRAATDSAQLDLAGLIHDPVGLPILEKAASVEVAVEPLRPTEVLVRYLRRTLGEVPTC